MIRYQLAQSIQELQGILDLQNQNLPAHISSAEAQEQGFVTVHHSMELLQRMNSRSPSIIAKVGEQVVGYNLAMTRDFADDIPVLAPMFRIIDGLHWRGQSMATLDYIVCGQVCVSKAYRGRGIFAAMYAHYKAHYAKHYACIVTEIASRNTRSLRAHEKLGFERIHAYRADNGEYWEIVRWDWSAES